MSSAAYRVAKAAERAGDPVIGTSRAYSLAILLVGLSTLSLGCRPPELDLPCTNQIVEGDVLHIELIARYAPDGEIWAGADISGYGAIPSCVGIDALATGFTFDAKIEGSHRSMLCMQFGFVPQWDAPRWTNASLPENLVPFFGAGSNEVALSRGAITGSAGCLGLYGISVEAITSDVFAAPSLDQPYGTVIRRYFRTNEPGACGADFVGDLDPTGATVCGDLYLVRVTR